MPKKLDTSVRGTAKRRLGGLQRDLQDTTSPTYLQNTFAGSVSNPNGGLINNTVANAKGGRTQYKRPPAPITGGNSDK